VDYNKEGEGYQEKGQMRWRLFEPQVRAVQLKLRHLKAA
jgi:hypothetical protein